MHNQNSGYEPEPEHKGSVWSHPYMLYVILTMGLFLILVFLGWMAWNNGWIPNRGINNNG